MESLSPTLRNLGCLLGVGAFGSGMDHLIPLDGVEDAWGVAAFVIAKKEVLSYGGGG